MPQEAASAFRDPTRLTLWTRRLLFLQLAVTLVALVADLLEYQVLTAIRDGLYTSEAEMLAAAEASDARQMIVGGAQFLVYLVAGFFILRWIHRANFNARQLGATDLDYTPGASIGWYFMPIANLWKPYEAMREIWRASVNPLAWRNQPISPILPWWWTFWILSNLLANIGLRIQLGAEHLEPLITGNLFITAADATDIPLNLLVLALVGRVHEMQITRYRRRALELGVSRANDA